MTTLVRASAAACLLTLAASVAAPAAAQSQAPPTPQPTTIDASRGGITIASGVNSLTIGARAQVRWTAEDREEGDTDTAGEGLRSEDGVISQFDVPRLRLSLSGGVYRPWLRYLFQLELSRASGEGGSRLKDAVLEVRPPDRNFRLQFGQFKVPFGLQQINSSGRLQFVDRAITDAKFNPAREMGAAFGGTVAGRRVGYDAGIFNGSGESIRQNNRSHLWVLRAFFNPFGAYAPAESAVDAGDAMILHVGAAVRGGDAIRGRAPASTIEEADNQRAVNVEFALKAPRFYATAEHFWMIDEVENPLPASDIDSRGYHAQAGFMVLPRTTEVAVLYARILGDTDVDDAQVSEVRGAVSYYFQAHNLKLQADAGQVGFGAAFASLPARARQGLPALGTRLVTGEDVADRQVRVQMTLSF